MLELIGTVALCTVGIWILSKAYGYYRYSKDLNLAEQFARWMTVYAGVQGAFGEAESADLWEEMGSSLFGSVTMLRGLGIPRHDEWQKQLRVLDLCIRERLWVKMYDSDPALILVAGRISEALPRVRNHVESVGRARVSGA
ncbi:hypothetical protein ACLB90_01700 [Stenotrophomonas sp. LGBM10]|uniref:hypothetical protein n=1 Tax=Stenotrophomonas sp. LGBM10 TaxID=3390038 RepID=UPI00398AD613